MKKKCNENGKKETRDEWWRSKNNNNGSLAGEIEMGIQITR